MLWPSATPKPTDWGTAAAGKERFHGEAADANAEIAGELVGNTVGSANSEHKETIKRFYLTI